MNVDVVSTGQLKAQSISIQVSTRSICNGSCKCCISRLTPNTVGVDEKVQRCSLSGLTKGLDFAERLGATHVILTGKAEPTQERPEYIIGLIERSRRQKFLVDMHTNGYLLQPGVRKDNPYTLKTLKNYGLTMITFSVFHFDSGIHKQITGLDVDFVNLIKEARSLGLLVRCSLVLAKSGIGTLGAALDYIRYFGEAGANMVVIREIWLPEFRAGKFNKEVYEWNKENFVGLNEFSYKLEEHVSKKHENAAWEEYPMYELSKLPWGARVFAMDGCFSDPEHGVNVTLARCEENDQGPVMKSIVHKPNGHGYRNWDSNANILY